MLTATPSRDLLGRPAEPEFIGHEHGQLSMHDELRRLRSPCPPPGSPVRLRGSVPYPTAVTGDLPRDRGRSATQATGDGAARLVGDEST
jgi:hypothetical protein